MLLSAVPTSAAPAPPRSFEIQNDQFVKDGSPFQLRSGSLHYFRVPREYWQDRMLRMRAMGLNSVTMYVAWNYHETKEGKIDGLGDVSAFLDVAQAVGMLVILRPGPYICGEWELGGLPAEQMAWAEKFLLNPFDFFAISLLVQNMHGFITGISEFRSRTNLI